MVETASMLDIVRLFVGSLILLYASYTDIKTRKASNILWIIMGSVGVFLLIIQYLTVGFDKIFYLLFIPIMIILIYVFFQLHLIKGGADAKAIMALAILVPLEPSILEFPLWNSFMPFSWVVFTNSLLLCLVLPLFFILLNITRRNVEFPYCFFGYRLSIEKAKNKFVWPLEKIVDGKRKFIWIPKKFDIDDDLEIFEKNGIEEIWVTTKIPFIVPLLIGFVCSFVLGDILFYFMSCIM